MLSNKKSKILLRKIQASDNAIIAKIIRDSLEEYQLNLPGTVYTDPTTDDLHGLFQPKNATYWIAVNHDEVVGGCGIFPTEKLPEQTAELVKLYVKKEFRGFRIGQQLVEQCINTSKKLGYTQLYLESFPSLKEAISLYHKKGFRKINEPMGDSGHFTCNYYMLLQL